MACSRVVMIISCIEDLCGIWFGRGAEVGDGFGQIVVTRTVGGYLFRWTGWQVQGLAICVSFARELSSSGDMRCVLFGDGFSRIGSLVDELAVRRSDASAEGSSIGYFEMELGISEVHSLYSLISGIPELFSTEEEFFCRIGGFREDLREAARILRRTVGNAR